MFQRRGLAATWTAVNPVLAAGEFGIETDTGEFKIGNGSTTWNSLPYAGGTPNAITSLTSDVTAAGPGAAAATVVAVGGLAAASVATGAVAANAATSANTANTIAKRSGGGDIASTSFTGHLIGNADTATLAAGASPHAITNAMLAQFPDQTVLGNINGPSAVAQYLTATTLTAAMVSVFDATTKGAVPPSGGGTTNFLRADGTWTTGAGGVTDVNGQTGSVTLTTTDIAEGTNKYATYANINTAIGAPANTFIFSNGTSQILGYPTWQLDPTTKFSNVDNTIAPNNLAAYSQAYSWNINVAPLQNSPNDSMRLHSFTVNLDTAATGFTFGTNGQAGELLGGGYNYGGNGASFGILRGINFYNGFGNGTDPGTVHNLSASAHSYQFSANITLDGQVNGYDFNLNVNAAAIPTSNFAVLWMSDFSQIPVDVYGYQGVVCQPNIAKIKNNHNFNGVTIFPTIATMEGNAGLSGIAVGGTVTTLGTGGFSALGVNTNIGTVPATANVQGLGMFPQITTMAATSGFHGSNISPTVTTLHGSLDHYQANPQVAGGDGSVSLFSGNMGSVHTTGQTSVMNLNGQTADGKQSIFSADGVNMNIGGQLIAQSGVGIGSQHVIFTSFVVPNGTAITGSDFLMNIFSPDVDFGDAGSSVAAGPNLGTNAMVAFAGQMHGHGSMAALDGLLVGGIFAEDFTLTEWRNVNAVVINAGYSGTCTNATAFYHEITGAGPFAANHWGLRVVSDIDNYVTKMAVNTPSQKVTNASVGLEVGGTDRALLVSRLTTAEKTALTALNGMIVYDTDLDKFQGYEAGAWTNLI